MLQNFAWIFFLSVVPVSEIRGAMIYAFSALDGVEQLASAYLLSVIGNFLPVPFVILLFRPSVKWLKTTKLFGRLAHWVEERTSRKAKELSRATAGALLIFVAIPFPTTGAWTGSMIASLLDIRFKYALPAILAGIMIAGLVVALLCGGVLNLGTLGEWLITK